MEQKWFETFGESLAGEEYIFLLDTIGGVRASLYSVEGNTYLSANRELFNGMNGNPSPYKKYESVFMDMMEHDKGLHVYRYRDGCFAEYRSLPKKVYDPHVYDGCQHEVILREEFGLEPQSAEAQEAFAAALKKAERFKKTLVYSCYIGDTPQIIERAKTASNAQLNKKFEYFSTPLSLCARNNDLAGFRAVAEAGADLTKAVTRGTVSPLGEAIRCSPDIVLYAAKAFPDVFDAHFRNWGGNVSACTDRRVYELLFDLYGTEGMEDLIFSMIQMNNGEGLAFLLEHGANVRQYHPRWKCTPLEFAERKYKQYKNPENPFTSLWQMVTDAAGNG